LASKLISRDEGMHCDLTCLLLQDHLVFRVTPTCICMVIFEAVTIKHEFIRDLIPVHLLGMNAGLMLCGQYIQFCVDGLMVALQQKKSSHLWCDHQPVSSDDELNFPPKNSKLLPKA
jgi:ribonucleotide reductase beta subunit family protein with ferritin-like domain